MFKALYGFFQLIFLLILFKMFAPGIYSLAVDLVTTLLVILNQAAGSMANGSLTL
ncbi:hypothetical protein HON36_01205 [Candidatus Parcubacteria bacterium]|jgi:hypothetical protein|nr:hypothetical protein [Candidatus Parcubacteria bacterium]MBT7228023.1 hypothetical protein [Candidatus Parcubacteria bacterium]